MRYLYTLLLLLVPLSAFGVEGFGEQNLNSPARFYTNTHDSFGNASPADALPTYEVYEQATGTPVTTGTMAVLNEAGSDGFYTGVFTPTTGLGFAEGETYCLRIEAEVDNAIGVDVTTFKVLPPLEVTVEEAVSNRFDIVDQTLSQLTDASITTVPTVAFTVGSSGGSTTVSNVGSLDGTFHELLAAGEGNPSLSVVYTFTLPAGSTASSLFVYYKVGSIDALNLPSAQAYNFETSTWDTLDLTFNSLTTALKVSSLSNNYTGSNQVRIRFTAPDTFQEQSLFIDRIYVNYSTPLTEFIANEFATVPSLVWESLLSDYEGGENAAETVLDIMATVEDIGVVGTVSSGTGSSYKVYMGGFNPAELITDVVQNQSKAITVAVQAQGSFSDPTPTAITVKVKDEEGTTITIDDSDITRLAETASFQIIKFTIPADDSDTLAPGYATIEIAFDDEKVQLSNAIRIIKKL